MYTWGLIHFTDQVAVLTQINAQFWNRPYELTIDIDLSPPNGGIDMLVLYHGSVAQALVALQPVLLGLTPAVDPSQTLQQFPTWLQMVLSLAEARAYTEYSDSMFYVESFMISEFTPSFIHTITQEAINMPTTCELRLLSFGGLTAMLPSDYTGMKFSSVT